MLIKRLGFLLNYNSMSGSSAFMLILCRRDAIVLLVKIDQIHQVSNYHIQFCFSIHHLSFESFSCYFIHTPLPIYARFEVNTKVSTPFPPRRVSDLSLATSSVGSYLMYRPHFLVLPVWYSAGGVFGRGFRVRRRCFRDLASYLSQPSQQIRLDLKCGDRGGAEGPIRYRGTRGPILQG
jgi:hypothetical protein